MGPFVYLLYALGFPRVIFGGLIHFAFIHKKKEDHVKVKISRAS